MPIRFSWKKHFLLLFTLACVLINSFAYVLYMRYREVHQSSSWVMQSYETLRLTWRMLSALQDWEVGQRGYLLTGSQDFLTPYTHSMERIDQEMERLRTQIQQTSPEQQIERLNKLTGDMDKLRALMQEQTKGYESGQRTRDMIISDLLQSKVLMDTIRTQINEIITAERAIRDTRAESEKRAEQRYVNTLLIGIILTISGLFATNAMVIKLTSRGRAIEEKLRASEDRLLMAMQGINDGVFDYNVTEGSFFFSPRFKEMLGYADNEFPNTLEALNEHLHPEDHEKKWDAVQRYFNKETPTYRAVFRMRHKNGEYRWIMSRGKGIWDENGKITRFIGAHTDITEEKKREEYLAHLNTELEGFTYIASHDLRSPLVNLKGFASEMRVSTEEVRSIVEANEQCFDEKNRQALDTALKRDIPEALHYISSAVEKMDALTTAILDLSRIGKRELRMEPVNTRSVVERITNTLAYDIGQRGIEMRIGDLPDVVTDALSLEQIFSNIIDNALKFLDNSRPGRVEISGTRQESSVTFSIRDNGRGIAEHDMHKVFEMFRRAGNSRDVRGNGMGMAYVKATVQRLGGRIWLESTVGEGTTFYFTIPRASAKE